MILEQGTQEQGTTESAQSLTLPQRVQALLHMRGGHLGNQVQVSDEDGTIVLDGVVGRFHHRQVAVSCAQHVVGVRSVIDRIVVRKSAVADDDEL
jgi:osmotically-inducible protein OsmY